MFFLVTQLRTPVCWFPNTNKPLGTGWHGNGVGCWWNTCKCWPICPSPTTSTGQMGFEIWCTCFTLWISVGWGSTIYVCQDILAMLLFDNSCFWQFLFFWFFFFLTDHSFDHSFLTIHSFLDIWGMVSGNDICHLVLPFYEAVRTKHIYDTCWLYSLCNFQYRQHYENTCSYNFDCWIYTNMYVFLYFYFMFEYNYEYDQY